jgi:D-methionine transport system substrate-binding protein
MLAQLRGNPNANGLVTRPELKDDPRIQKLAKLLTSQEVKNHIKDTCNGAVIPV